MQPVLMVWTRMNHHWWCNRGRKKWNVVASHHRASASNTHFLGILPNHMYKVASSIWINWIVKVPLFDFVVKEVHCKCYTGIRDVLCIVESLVLLQPNLVVSNRSLLCNLICPVLWEAGNLKKQGLNNWAIWSFRFVGSSVFTPHPMDLVKDNFLSILGII